MRAYLRWLWAFPAKLELAALILVIVLIATIARSFC